jgi:hypothetical protein
MIKIIEVCKLNLKDIIISLKNKNILCLENTYVHKKTSSLNLEKITLRFKRTGNEFSLSLTISDSSMSLDLSLEDELTIKELFLLQDLIKKIEPILKEDNRIRLLSLTGQILFSFPYDLIRDEINAHDENEFLVGKFEKAKLIKFLLCGICVIISLIISNFYPIIGFFFSFLSLLFSFNDKKSFHQLLWFLKECFSKRKSNHSIIRQLKYYSKNIRNMGILSIQNDYEKEENLIIKEGISLLFDGFEKDEIVELLNFKIEKLKRKKFESIKTLRNSLIMFIFCGIFSAVMNYNFLFNYLNFYLFFIFLSLIGIFLTDKFKAKVLKDDSQNKMIVRGLELISEQNSPIVVERILKFY